MALRTERSVVSLTFNGKVLYMITCKDNRNGVKDSKKKLLDAIASVRIQLVDYRFEGDGSNLGSEKLHLHGIFYGPKFIKFRDYRIKGWNMFIVKCWSSNGEGYCLKSDSQLYVARKQMTDVVTLSTSTNLFDYDYSQPNNATGVMQI